MARAEGDDDDARAYAATATATACPKRRKVEDKTEWADEHQRNSRTIMREKIKAFSTVTKTS
jgi:hypothetical protein